MHPTFDGLELEVAVPSRDGLLVTKIFRAIIPAENLTTE